MPKNEDGEDLCKHCNEVLLDHKVSSDWHGMELCDMQCVREYIDDLENGRV